MPKRLNITLNDTLYHQIKELSTKELRSISNMIEFALNEYINGAGISSASINYSNATNATKSKSSSAKAPVTPVTPVIGNKIDEEELLNDPSYDPNF